MNVGCSAIPCPIILNSTCVIYEGGNLIYTGINTNDTLQTALQKIDAVIGDIAVGTSGTAGTSGTTGTSGSSGTAGTSGDDGISSGRIFYFNESQVSSVSPYKVLSTMYQMLVVLTG